MAKLYHNGEYLESGGGNVASAMPSYYVELDATPNTSHPIIINGLDFSKPFNLTIKNISDDIIDLISEGDAYASPTIVISNGTTHKLYRISINSDVFRGIPDPAYNTSGSLAEQAFASYNNLTTMRIEPYGIHTFIGITRLATYYLVSQDKVYTKVLKSATHASSRTEKLYIYSEVSFSGRPKPFMLATNYYTYTGTDFAEDSNNNALTIGNIHFSRSISINQMEIFGALRITGVKMYDVDGNELTGSARNFQKVPFILEFSFSGANEYVSLWLFNT